MLLCLQTCVLCACSVCGDNGVYDVIDDVIVYLSV